MEKWTWVTVTDLALTVENQSPFQAKERAKTTKAQRPAVSCAG